MARTGGYGDKKLKQRRSLNLKRKRNSDLYGLMILGYIKNYIHMCTSK